MKKLLILLLFCCSASYAYDNLQMRFSNGIIEKGVTPNGTSGILTYYVIAQSDEGEFITLHCTFTGNSSSLLFIGQRTIDDSFDRVHRIQGLGNISYCNDEVLKRLIKSREKPAVIIFKKKRNKQLKFLHVLNG